MNPAEKSNSRLRPALRMLPLLLLVLLAAGVWFSGLPGYLHIHTLREHSTTLRAFVREHRILGLAGYVTAVAVTTASCLPGTIPILMLAGGFLFGTWLGGGAAATGLTLGSALAFAAVRTSLGTVLRDKVNRAGARLKAVFDGVQSQAFGYILTLRLVPFAPFELMSIAVALAGVPLRPYLFGTFLGVLPATFIYGGIGAGIGRLIDRGQKPNLHTLLTPSLAVPLLALGLMSLIATVFIQRRGRSKPSPPTA